MGIKTIRMTIIERVKWTRLESGWKEVRWRRLPKTGLE